MKSLFSCFLLCIATLASAQGWRQTFEGLLYPADIVQTPDGGAVLLANSLGGGAQGRQIVLSKTDQDGRFQWQKSFGAAGDDEGRALCLTSNGTVAVAGKMSFLANNGDALLALFSLNGQKLWERNYNFGVLDDAKSLQQMPDGGFTLAVEADNQLRLLRTDSLGTELWSRAYPQTLNLIVQHLELRKDGGFVVTLLRNNLPIGIPAAVVLQLNAAGDPEFQATLPHFSNFVTTDQVRCKPASDSTFWLVHRDSVYLLDRDTSVLKQWRVSAPFDLYLTDLIPASDGGLFVLGTNYSFGGTAFSRSYFARFNAGGTEIWRRFYDAPNYLHSSWAAEACQDGGFFLSGNYAKNGGYFSYLLRTDSLGQTFTNQVAGRVFWDKNNDCQDSPADLPLKGWLLRIERPNGDLHYTTTATDGSYHFEAGTGVHRVLVLMPSGLWSSVCLPSADVVFDQQFQSGTLDFPIKSTAFCPLPRVDGGIDYWLHCAENRFVVRYSNAGTALASNAAVTLRLDSLLTIQSASQAFSPAGPHAWTFPLGDLPALADSSFWVDIQTDCGMETLDRNLCVTAEIVPDEPCLSPLTGPLLVADGRCEGDSVRFQVRNIGLPMTDPLPYIVVEDNIIFLQGSGEVLLGAGEVFMLSFPANGSTWRLEVLQSPDTPEWLSDAHVAAVVEACSSNGSFSSGYVNQFSLYDGGYFSETECRPVVSVTQGQEKLAYPSGWTDAHLIEPNTDLEYALHFQNTSGDSIQVFSLRDTLDALLLDPASVVPGPASHPYQFDLSGAGVLNFRFLAPALADSDRVWVKFRVAQQKDLDAGTIIRNRAWAYPDFAAPIQTNETFHTVGVPLLSGTGTVPKPVKTGFQVWPVPTVDDLNISLEETGSYRCKVADMTGRTILDKSFSGKTLLIGNAELPAGMFLVSVYKSEQILGTEAALKLRP